MADTVGAHNLARLEASFGLTRTAGSDEVVKEQRPDRRIVPAHSPPQQLSFLAAVCWIDAHDRRSSAHQEGG
jgi:hypothetical protein